MPADNRRSSFPSRVVLRRRSPPPYSSISQSVLPTHSTTSNTSFSDFASLTVPTAFGLSNVDPTPPTLPILIPQIIGVAPDKAEQKIMRRAQRDAPNLTTLRAPDTVDQIAYPVDEDGNVIPPEKLSEHVVDYNFNLPLCWHNVPIRIFKAQSAQFKNLWCGACFLRKGKGYCNYWVCISNLIDSENIQYYYYTRRDGTDKISPLPYPLMQPLMINESQSSSQSSSTISDHLDTDMDVFSASSQSESAYFDVAITPPRVDVQYSRAGATPPLQALYTEAPNFLELSDELEPPFTQRQVFLPASPPSPSLGPPSQSSSEPTLSPLLLNSPPSHIDHRAAAPDFLRPGTPPSPLPDLNTLKEPPAQREKRIWKRQGINYKNDVDNDLRFQYIICAEFTASEAALRARNAKYLNPSSIFLTGSPSASSASSISSLDTNSNVFSGFALELPPISSPSHQKASNLWVPPPDEARRFTEDIVAYQIPTEGYQVFLNRLGTCNGVDAEQFWDAFVICRTCNKIILGELFTDHICQF